MTLSQPPVLRGESVSSCLEPTNILLQLIGIIPRDSHMTLFKILHVHSTIQLYYMSSYSYTFTCTRTLYTFKFRNDGDTYTLYLCTCMYMYIRMEEQWVEVRTQT